MHEVAVVATAALCFVELAAPRLPKVRNGRVLYTEEVALEALAAEADEAGLCVLLIAILDVDVSHHVVPEVVAHVHLINVPKPRQLFEYRFVPILKVLTLLAPLRAVAVTRAGGGDSRLRQRRRRGGGGRLLDRLGILPHVLNQHALRKRRPVVSTAAAIAVPARADLEVERAVHAVLFRPVDPREVRRAAARAAAAVAAAAKVSAARAVVAAAAAAPSVSTTTTTSSSSTALVVSTTAPIIVPAAVAVPTATPITAVPSATVAVPAAIRHQSPREALKSEEITYFFIC